MPALAPFTFKGLNEQLLGIWVNWMPQVNQNMIDSPCFLCLLCFWSLSLYRCGVDMWRAEGRGPHLSWLISATSMCNPCGQHAYRQCTRVYILRANKGLSTCGENTLCLETPTSGKRWNDVSTLQDRAWEYRPVLTLHQVSAAWLFPRWNPYRQGAWLPISFLFQV